MKSAQSALFKGRRFTQDDVLKAMSLYRNDPNRKKILSGKKYAVWNKGRSYSPKDLLSLMSESGRSTFSGGKETNRVFQELGFRVCSPRPTRMKAVHSEKIPNVETLVRRLLRRTWTSLSSTVGQLEDDPGVYVIARSSRARAGKRISEEAIFYVGMSNHQGLKIRLRQFKASAEGGQGHSAGIRLRKKYEDAKNGLLLAYVSVPCRMKKSERCPDDLRTMGIIAAAEMYVLARVKQKVGCEPELNAM